MKKIFYKVDGVIKKNETVIDVSINLAPNVKHWKIRNLSFICLAGVVLNMQHGILLNMFIDLNILYILFCFFCLVAYHTFPNKSINWLVGFYGKSTFVGYLTPNPFLCK